MRSVITHWLPIVTFCPENSLPDFVFVELHTTKFIELYSARKKIRKAIAGKKMYMEDLATVVAEEFPQAEQVVVRLMFNKHRVEVYNAS